MKILIPCVLLNRSILAISLVIASLIGGSILPSFCEAQDFIPRKQTKPPGPPLSPEEALKRMVVPEGFHVEIVASEPDIFNPVAMAFDDSGRIYVTESFEYPRHEPGPGRDRIKILTDTDGDGKVDRVKVFAEGLNIPSGIAVGHGGVWVANAPDILFLEDTDGDDVADRTTVVVTGFGRFDTHELPNALTWGPDGYLYGLNGVFNPCKVIQDGKEFNFTCAMFRIHPKTKKFEIFCEGTSNPWGIAFDSVGSSFVSACVIDHLWHLTESGYYLRQGGPYPPHTWWAESIVKHKHQMAAYCGIEYFDSDAFPEAYRNKLYMGNIHGGCINVDRIERHGATYRGFGEPDFLTANDVWFMPVAQKVGPDGCLYVLDWYDRYHCYQDASADPKGVDRGHGRLYRIVHDKRPSPRYRDISKLEEGELVQALADPNIYVRQRAQLELAERAALGANTLAKLEQQVTKGGELRTQMHSMWALAGAGALRGDFLVELLKHPEAEIRAWGVRVAGDQFQKDKRVAELCLGLAHDPDPRVRVQVAIAAPKFLRSKLSSGQVSARPVTSSNLASGKNLIGELVQAELDVLARCEDDPITPRIVWQNLLPIIDEVREPILARVQETTNDAKKPLLDLLPRLVNRWLDGIPKSDWTQEQRDRILASFKIAESLKGIQPQVAADVLRPLIDRVRNRELDTVALRSVAHEFLERPSDYAWDKLRLERIWDKQELLLGLISGNPSAVQLAEKFSMDGNRSGADRREVFQLVADQSSSVVSDALFQALKQLGEKKELDKVWRDIVLDQGIAKLQTKDYDTLQESMRPLSLEIQGAIAERMCQREPTASLFLTWVAEGKFRKELLSPNRIRLMASQGSESAKGLLSKVFGSINTEANKERERVVKTMGDTLRGNLRGDPVQGWLVYDRICGQCHIMHQRGIEVGPNITLNGRGSFEQLLVSVFNPSLVIGEAYRSVTARTIDGTIVTGLLVSRDDRKTVIKTQGGKEVTLLAEEIEAYQQDKKSLMPEGIETQLTEKELADLFALLTLEAPPGEPESGNAIISGTPENLHRSR